MIAVSGARPGHDARAYAATQPSGGLLHYVWEIESSRPDGSEARTDRREVWRTSTALRTVSRVAGSGETRVLETVVSDRRWAQFDSAANRVVVIEHAAGRAKLPTAEVDPVQRFAALHRGGALSEMSRSEFEGREVVSYREALPSGEPGSTFHTDLETGALVAETYRQEYSDGGSAVFTARFVSYERLALTAESRGDLAMAPHPGVPVDRPSIAP